MNEQAETNVVSGFFPMVKAEGDVSIREAGAGAIVAGGDVTMREAGAGMFIAGGDLEMSEAGAGTMMVGGSARLSEAGVGNMLVGEATLNGSRVGVLLTAKADLHDSTVVLNTPQAIGLGVAAGVTVFLLGKLFRRG